MARSVVGCAMPDLADPAVDANPVAIAPARNCRLKILGL